MKKLYFNPYLDMFNSEIISYYISDRLTAPSIEKAQFKAIKSTSDCLVRCTLHLDQVGHIKWVNTRNTLKIIIFFIVSSEKKIAWITH